MEDEVIVACHAPVLSLLLYETARSTHDQKGLLIGQVFNEVISKKTDDNEINKEKKTVIYIKHCMPVDREIFGNVGDINKTELQTLTESKHVVGWYSFRRNTRLLNNTLSEMLIHKTLLDITPNCKPDLFVAAFMSASTGQNLSTHTFNHIFTRYHPNRERFEPIKLKIYSLSDKSVNSSASNSFPLSSRFERIISSSQKEENSVKSVLSVHDQVGNLLVLLNTKLQEQENIRSELEKDVEELRKKLGQDKKQQEMVVEEEPEKEEFPESRFICFNRSVKYNPNRTSNPIKVSSTSPVPDDDDGDDGDDDDDANNAEDDIIEVENDDKERTPATTTPSLKSYADMAKNSPSIFSPRVPKLRPGLSPLPNQKKNTVTNNDMEDAESQDMFESAEETDENSENMMPVNNSQNSNQMDTDR